MLDQFITSNRTDIIERCKEKAHCRLVAAHSNAQMDDGVPLFLDQLVVELRHVTPTRNAAITEAALQHGHYLLAQGFTVSQVVHEYGDICQAVTELAVERNAPISTDDFRRLNRCLDDAIAGAVTEYGRQRDEAMGRNANAEDQRLVDVTTKLRAAIQTATTALEVVKTGSVGLSGSTGNVLDMSLHAAVTLVDNLLAELAARRAAPASIIEN